MKLAPVNIKNKRATFDYELIDTYTAGIIPFRHIPQS